MSPMVREQRIQTTCLLILSGVALALSLHWLKGVMVPFVLAVFLSFALAPLIDLLIRRAKFPRVLALLVTLSAALAVMLLFGGLVTNAMRNISPSLGRLESGIDDIVAEVSKVLRLDELQVTIDAWTRDDVANEPDSESKPEDGAEPPSKAEEEVQSAEPLAGPPATAAAPDSGASLVAALGRRVVPAIGSVLDGITNLLSKSVLVLIFLMFLLGGRHNFDIRENRTTLGVVERQVRSYLVTKIFTSFATGLLTAVALRMIGVPSALLFGLLAFLLNFIPSIGSIIAALLPIPMALITFDLSTSAGIVSVILTLAIPGSIQFLIGNVIETMLMGDSLDLHPVVVVLSLIFWGTIWGPVGMLLATPITAVIRLMLEKLEPTQPIARALSGKLGS